MYLSLVRPVDNKVCIKSCLHSKYWPLFQHISFIQVWHI